MMAIAWSYLIIFAVILILCALFQISIHQRQWYILFLCLLISILYIAYNYVPFEDDDLAYYYQLLNDMRHNSLSWALFHSDYTYEMGSNLIFVFVAKLTSFDSLLQLIFIGNLFIHVFLLCSLDKKRMLKGEAIVLFWIFFSAFFYIRLNLSNLRSPLASAYFAYALQLEMTDKKYKGRAVCYYILAVLTHRSALIFLLFRIGAHYLNKMKLSWLAPFLCIWGSIPHLLINTLSMIPGAAIQDLVYKLNAYTTRADTIEKYDIRIKYILFLMVLFLCALVWWISIKKYSYKINNEYFTYIKLSVCFLVGAWPYYTILDRSLRFLIVGLLPLWSVVMNSRLKKPAFLVKVTGSVMLTGMSLYQFVNLYHYYSFR